MQESLLMPTSNSKVSNFIFRVGRRSDQQSILSIAEQQLGKNYLTKAQLQLYFELSYLLCTVVEIEDEIVGFSLMELRNKQRLMECTQLSAAQLESLLGNHFPVGYRSLTAVHPNHTGKGVATFLVQKGIQFLRDKTTAKAVFCDAWKSEEGGIHIESALLKNGYQRGPTIPNYWQRQSINKQFECAVCGIPPCSCEAVLYYLIFED